METPAYGIEKPSGMIINGDAIFFEHVPARCACRVARVKNGDGVHALAVSPGRASRKPTPSLSLSLCTEWVDSTSAVASIGGVSAGRS